MHFLALPTWRGLLLLFLAAAALAVVYVNSGFITAFTAALLSAVVLSSFLMAQLSFAGLVFKRTFLQDGTCNTPLYLEISLQNRLPLYRQSCLMVEDYPFVISGQTSFVIPALAPREKFCAVSPVTPEKRGVYELKKVYLCSGDPLGLFRRKKRFFGSC